MARLMGFTGWRRTALALIGLALAACVREGRSVIAAPCVVPQADLDAALAVHGRHTTELMAIPGVVGTAVGVSSDCRAVITIFTKEASVAGLPDTLEWIPVEVRVTGEIVAQSS